MASRSETVLTTTVVSNTTFSSAVDLGQNWTSAYLVIKSMVSNSQLNLRAATTLAGTYRRVGYPSVGTSTVAVNDWAIPSSTTNAIVPIPRGLRFIKIEQTMTAADGNSFDIVVGGG